eukprot:1161420-Pelagomonas_calceolata.AAC.2
MAFVFLCASFQPGCKQDPKKPVVTETFEELVFSEPRVDFYQRITHHQPSECLNCFEGELMFSKPCIDFYQLITQHQPIGHFNKKMKGQRNPSLPVALD